MIDKIEFDLKTIKKLPDNKYCIIFEILFKEKEDNSGNNLSVFINMPMDEADLSSDGIEKKKMEFLKFFRECHNLTDSEILQAYGSHPKRLFQDPLG